MTDPLSRAARVRLIRAQLAARFPACFQPKGARKRPLAKGIHHALHAARVADPDLAIWSRRQIRMALTDYTRGASYLSTIVEGAARVDLYGTPVAVVSASEAATAILRLRALDKPVSARALEAIVAWPLCDPTNQDALALQQIARVALERMKAPPLSAEARRALNPPVPSPGEARLYDASTGVVTMMEPAS